MCWIWLFLAILIEVAATVCMKLSSGFTRIVPTISMFLLYGLSLLPMVAALKQIEAGAVYAIWSAAGTVLVAIIGVVMFHEPASALKVGSIALIVVGVVCLNLSMRQPRDHSAARRQPQTRESSLRRTTAPVQPDSPVPTSRQAIQKLP